MDVRSTIIVGLLMLLVSGVWAAEAEYDPAPDPDAETTQGQTLEDQVRAILDSPMEEARKSERCISTHQYSRVEVLDTRTVVFHGRGDKAWLNQLRTPCAGLRSDHTLRFELRQNSVCSMDTFRGISMIMGGPMPMGPTCFLSEFEPITKDQVTMLKEALDQQREAERKARKRKKETGDESP
jgi:hypothetical protein